MDEMEMNREAEMETEPEEEEGLRTWQGLSDGRRLDVQLSEYSGLTRSRVSSLMADGYLTVNGAVVTKAGTRPKAGAAFVLTEPAPVSAVPEPEDIPLQILYEDRDLAVVVKPCGMVVHPAPGNEKGTLVNALLYHLDGLGTIGGEIRPGIVHRLDKDTSGLLLVAKNDAAHLELSRQMQMRETEKHYLALVEGNPGGRNGEREGRIDRPIGRSPADRKKMAVVPGGREAVTLWKILEEGRGCSLLDVHILTGRTHQIRVHMQSTGHPVCGDPLYGAARGARVPRMMLHAHSLAFTHPVTGERMQVVCPPPDAFMEGLRGLGITWEEKKENCG